MATAPAKMGLSFMFGSDQSEVSDEVEDDEEDRPDQGHEVPVGAADLDRERSSRAGPGHEHEQPDHPRQQVEGVQAGQRVEVGAELARAQGLAEVPDQPVVLEELEAEEEQRQAPCQEEAQP